MTAVLAWASSCNIPLCILGGASYHRFSGQCFALLAKIVGVAIYYAVSYIFVGIVGVRLAHLSVCTVPLACAILDVLLAVLCITSNFVCQASFYNGFLTCLYGYSITECTLILFQLIYSTKHF